MSNFSIQLTEEVLRSAIEAMSHYKRNRDEVLVLNLSIELVSDGIGFEMFNQQAYIGAIKNTPVPEVFRTAFESEETR